MVATWQSPALVVVASSVSASPVVPEVVSVDSPEEPGELVDASAEGPVDPWVVELVVSELVVESSNGGSPVIEVRPSDESRPDDVSLPPVVVSLVVSFASLAQALRMKQIMVDRAPR